MQLIKICGFVLAMIVALASAEPEPQGTLLIQTQNGQGIYTG